jgi:hypothetical protein
VTGHLREWITGLASRKSCAAHAPELSGAGMFGVNYYNAELEAIGDRYQIVRVCGQTDRDLAFRIALEIANRLHDLEADLSRVVNFTKVGRP